MGKLHRIGIMGGRLSRQIDNKIQAFPFHSWKDEFEKASICGFQLIEWVFDLYHTNPLMDIKQVKEIKSLSNEYDVKINSVCADYFMEKKLFKNSNIEIEKNLKVLKNLINQCQELGIKILEIPLVDTSSLKSSQDKICLIKNLQKVLPLAEKNNVILALETDLPPHPFKELLTEFEHNNIKANYDTGNSTALGYDLKEELEIIGPWIINIHIKDRMLHGDTVSLGTGDTNFDLFFSELTKINYKGDFIIQGARKDELKIKPEDTCKEYLDFLKKYIDRYLQV